METVIRWVDVEVEPPPFQKPILALFGYRSSSDLGISWESVIEPYPVIVSEDSPNDSDSHREIEDFRRNGKFKDCCFFVTDRSGNRYPLLDIESDAIMFWAEMPDFGAMQ